MASTDDIIEAARLAILSYPFPNENEPKSDIDWYMERLREAVYKEATASGA